MGSVNAETGRPAPAMVELVLLRVQDGRLAYRRVTGRPGDDEHPDAAATRLAAGGTGALALLHSTSWRYDRGELLLTYVALPDPCPWLPARPLTSHDLAVSDDPVRPAPSVVEVEHVVAHACRHLAWLDVTDPCAATALAGSPDLRALLAGWSPAPAGRLDPTGRPTAEPTGDLVPARDLATR